MDHFDFHYSRSHYLAVVEDNSDGKVEEIPYHDADGGTYHVHNTACAYDEHGLERNPHVFSLGYRIRNDDVEQGIHVDMEHVAVRSQEMQMLPW